MKKSITLTIVTFLLYFLQSLISGILIGTYNADETIAQLISIIVLAIVFLMIKKKELFSYYGLCIWQCDNFLKTHFLLFLVPLVNLPYLFFGTKIDIPAAIISSIFIGIMEELIFRSFLCRFIEQISNENRAILISSLLFGGFHLLNIGNYPLVFVLLQVLYAFAIGIAFAVVFYKTKSILPCMAIHAVVDFLGSFELKPILIADSIGTIICCVCAVYYYFFQRKNTIVLHS